MSYKSSQERIDSLTMKINNPNIKGSGYIEHPPQVPFAGRVVMQPSTVNPDDVPEWYAQGAPGYARQHPGNIARAPNGAHRPHQHSLYGQAQPPAASYRPTGMEQPQEYRQVKLPSMPQRNAATHERPKGHQFQSHQNAPSVSQVPMSAEKTKIQATAPPGPLNEEQKLSKSQKAKLRKKMREGRM